jgi:hypothetical protein
VSIVEHHSLEVTVRFVDIGGIVDHQCLEVIVRFVDIAVNCCTSLFRGVNKQSSLSSDGQ